MEKVERLVKGLMSAALLLRLYPADHPRVRKAIAEIAESVWAVTMEGEPVLLAIYESQFLYNGELLYDLSVAGARLIQLLESRGIHGIRFQPGATREEIRSALECLTASREDEEPFEKVRGRLRETGIQHIEFLEESVGEDVPLSQQSRRLSDSLRGRLRVPIRAYTQCLDAMRDLMVDVRRGREMAPSAASEAVSLVVESSELNPGVLRWLTQMADYEEFGFNHAANSCVFAVSFASQHTPDPQLVQEIGQAALLHDVGMMTLPEEIIYKPDALTEEERRLVEEHPVRGAKILSEAPGVGPLAPQAAYLHHINHDGSGYPKIGPRTRVGLLPRLMTVIDTYNALTTRRPFREPVPPETAMGILLELAGTKLDPRIVARFIDRMGIYPIGTAVSLDTGEIAVVAAPEPGQPTRPQVRLLTDREGEPLEEPEVVSLLEKGDGRPVRTIQRSIDLEARLVPLAFPEGQQAATASLGGISLDDVRKLSGGLLR